MRCRVADGASGGALPRCAVDRGGSVAGVFGPGPRACRGVLSGGSGAVGARRPAGPAVSRCGVRPRVRVFRVGAPARSGGRAGGAAAGAAARGDADRRRGRPRVGVPAPRQRSRPRGDRPPGRVAGGGGRRRPSGAQAGAAAGGGRVWAGRCRPAHRLRRRVAARSGAGLHPRHLHRDDRVGPGRGGRGGVGDRGRLRPRGRGPASCRGPGGHVPLHLLQGDGREPPQRP